MFWLKILSTPLNEEDNNSDYESGDFFFLNPTLE
jgi:hypothetical protein